MAVGTFCDAPRAAARTEHDLARGATGSEAEGRDGTGAITRVDSGAPPELRRHGLAPPRREWGSRPVVDMVTPINANATIVHQQRRQAARNFNWSDGGRGWAQRSNLGDSEWARR